MPSIPEYVDGVYRIIGENRGFCRAATFPDLSAALELVTAAGNPASEQPPWLALPLFVCEALGGDLAPAYHVAAALELGRIAAGCLDEWQDQDTDEAVWQALGAEQTVNLAAAMIGLTHLSLGRLADLDLEPELTLRLHQEFSQTLLYMCEGQHADLNDRTSLDNYAQVAGAKTGSLLRLGCRAGAMIAGATAETIAHYGEFGQALGILAQAWNDLYGLTGNGGKRDRDHGRSLPILAAAALDGKAYAPGTAEGQAGELYALTQAQIFHRRACQALAGCPAPGRLALFLDRYTIEHLLGGKVTREYAGSETDDAT